VTYLLDTNTFIYVLKQVPAVLSRFLSHPPSDYAVSVVVEAELRAGAAKSQTPAATLRRVEAALAPLTDLPFDSSDAKVYARIRSALERAGTPIGAMDLLIAAHATSRNLVLVTNNEREFRRVRGLTVENWVS
jgi:tRNA(fMet)-specific endonuclease VapC